MLNYYTYPKTSTDLFKFLLENLIHMEHFEFFILKLI